MIGELLIYETGRREKRDWAELAHYVTDNGGQWVVVVKHLQRKLAPKGVSRAIAEHLEEMGCHAQVVTLEGRGPNDPERTWTGWLSFARAIA